MSNAVPPPAGSVARVFAVVAEDHHELRWIVDCEAGTLIQGDGDVDAVITGTTEDIVLMLTDQENLGGLLRAGRIRHLVVDEQADAPPDPVASARRIAAILRACVQPDDAASPRNSA